MARSRTAMDVVPVPVSAAAATASDFVARGMSESYLRDIPASTTHQRVDAVTVRP
jgi:hypothetical protein